MTKDSWMFCENESIGCSICKNVKLLGLGAFNVKSQHLSSELCRCSVPRDGKKVAAQKALRKKIIKHAASQAHIAASNILSEQNEKRIKPHSKLLSIYGN